MATPSTTVSRELLLSPQVMSDGRLAWQLQAEEYKKYYQSTSLRELSTFLGSQGSVSPLYQFPNTRSETISFNLRATSTDGECFFDAVDRAGFTRDALVEKLLNNSTESTRAIFAHEIRQFLYLGSTGSHSSKEEDEACQQLLTPDRRDLFFALQSAEEAFRPRVDEARSELGARETHQKHPPALLDLLRQKNSRLTQRFEQAYQAVLDADKAIYKYCRQTDVFKSYVTLYLKEARGYIPFSRDFGREIPETTIDVINQLFGFKIQVYLPCNQGGTQLQLANQLQLGEVIPIFHNGINHFWGLIVNSSSNTHSSVACEQNNSPVVGRAFIVVSLPTIPYDRKRLDDIIKKLEVSAAVMAQIEGYLKHIEKQVAEIKDCQSGEHPEDCYQAIRSATNEIRTTAKTLYELTNPYHQSFPNTLRGLIFQWIIPLEEAVLKRLEMTKDEWEALVLKTKHLYGEQSFISRQTPLQQALMQHLGKVKTLLLEPSRPNPRCYISYAWPSKENKAKEYWVQPFLYVLYDHLTEAGIRVVMDIRDNKPGDSIYRFMEQYHEGNYVILVGTESLLQKHRSDTAHAVKTELSVILNRFEQDQKQFGQSRIYPLLISGTINTAYPEIYDKYRTVRDARDQGYLGTLKKLTDWIYERRVSSVRQQHTDLWEIFNKKCPGLSKGSKAVGEEIAIGYHRQRLDYLRQDIQHQSVEAQEKTQHSQAVQTEQIGALLKSQGTNPQTLFDENGQQFQRPYSNSDFIQRKELWEKMTQHFKQSEQQILTLTAHGLGGMGKTELAGYYYQHPPRPYTLRAWFNASSKESIYLQYVELAKSQGVQFLESMPIEDKVRGVKTWLESQKDSLLVYDNVSALGVVEGLLPERGKHHILMTSRNSVGFPRHQTLDVDVMAEEEAIDLIVKITGFQDDEQLRRLVDILGRLPLALAQAGAYIAEKQTSIEYYLELYQKHQAEILKDNTLERNPKHEPVWVTFDMNFKALEIDCPTALNTLKQASWLNSIEIPERFLQSMINQDTHTAPELLWPDIKKHIGRYSLMKINVIQHQLSIHSLLQDIIRSKQAPEEQLQQFKECFESLNALEKSLYQSNLTVYKTLLPHAECLNKHAKEVAISVTDDKARDFLSIEPVCLTQFYFRLGFLNQQALIFLQQVISIHEKHYGKGHVETAQWLGNLGIVYRNQGKLAEAQAQYEGALGIKEHHYGKDHVETAGVLGNLGTVYREQGKLEQAREYTERALGIKEHHYGKDHVETAGVLGNLGNVYRDQGKLEQAREYTERALGIKEHHYGKDHVETAGVLGNLGTVYREQGKLEQAREYTERALRIQEHHYGKDHVETAVELGNLGSIYLQQGKLAEAQAQYERALGIEERHYGKGHVETAKWLGNLGVVYCQQGKLTEAQAQHERALGIKERHYGKGHVETTVALVNLGIVYRDQGKFPEAQAQYERALGIEERHYGKGHVKTAGTLGNLGTVYRDQGKLAGAQAQHERALGIQERHYGKGHVETAVLLGSLGTVYCQQGKLAEAQAQYERALGIQERHYGKGHVETAKWLGNLGTVYCQQGKLAEAQAQYERALEIQERHYGKEHVETAKWLGNLGTVYCQQGKFAEAQVQYERALGIEERHYSKGHVETAGTLGNLGIVYRNQGKFAEAQVQYERVLGIKESHYGKDHPEVADTLFNLAINNLQSNQLTIARNQLQSAQNIYRQHFPAGHPNLTKIEQRLQVLSSVSFHPVLAADQKSVPAIEHTSSITALKLGIHQLSQEGVKRYRIQKYKEAIELFQQALSLQQQISSLPHEKIATLHFYIGSTYLLQKDYPSAKSSLQLAYDMRVTLLGASHTATQKAQSRLQECQSAIEQNTTLLHEIALVVWFDLVLKSQNASSLKSEKLVNGNHSNTQNESQPRVEEGGSALLPRASNNRTRAQRIYCPYFSKTALSLGFAALTGGAVLAVAVGKRYYSAP